jgi:hypothetical protein
MVTQEGHHMQEKRYQAAGAVSLIVFALLAGTAQAQDTPVPATAQPAVPNTSRPAIRVGFSKGNTFQNGSARVHLEGFEIGGDVPLTPKAGPDTGLFFSPTWTLGGSNRKGPDTDGNVYRFLVNGKYAFAKSGVYVGAGLGYGFTQARVHEFHNVSGVAGEYLIGYTFPKRRPHQTQPFLEATYYDGGHSQLRGVSVDVGLRL